MKKAEFTKEQAKQALIGHYPYMTQALGIALNRTPAWRLAKDGAPCSLLDVFTFAKSYDETHPRKEKDPSFFCVSFEGAIGYSATGLEYMTSWIFLPMEPGAERDALVKKTAEEFNKAEAELAAKEKAAKEAAEKAATEKAAQTAEAPAKKRFCKHCGAPIKNPNAKFCSSCGQPL